MKLGAAMLFVKDFVRMREFYENMLQTKPVDSEWTGSWALFHTEGASFALHAIPEEIGQNINVPSPPKPRETSSVKLIFHVTDVPAERTRLETMGVMILQREWQNPAESCDCVDPEGNVFQISRAAF